MANTTIDLLHSLANIGERSDSNIAGPGVLLAFFTTGVFTVALSLESLRLQRKMTSERHETNNNIESQSIFSIDMRAHVLEAFLIQLSDQQLLLGLVVLVCAFIEYYHSALGGNDNFWHAADVACFSMSNHAATMLALRAFFRQHRKLTMARVSLMMVVFVLWAVIGYYMLHPAGPYYKTTPIVRFWRGATYIEFLGVFWVYTLTFIPIFISSEAIGVGDALSANDRGRLQESLRAWEEKCGSSSRKCLHLASLNRLPRAIIIRLLLGLDKEPTWKTRVLSMLFNLFFFWVVFIMWLFTLSALGVGFFTSKRGMGWDFGQLLSLAMVLLPLQSVPSAIASEQSSRRSHLN